jgi:hypothetical protein
MFQMLTGVLPYDTPTAADLDRLMRGELTVAPRVKNPKIPKPVNDIVLKAIAPAIHLRYQRASELLEDVLAVRSRPRRMARPAVGAGADDGADAQDIQVRLKARETPQPRFCWHCRKPLHARSDRCPFCGEAQ